MRNLYRVWISTLVVAFGAFGASAQSFRVQCPISTITHPLTGSSCGSNPTGAGCNNTEPVYSGPTQYTLTAAGKPGSGTTGGFVPPVAGTVHGASKCQQISGG